MEVLSRGVLRWGWSGEGEPATAVRRPASARPSTGPGRATGPCPSGPVTSASRARVWTRVSDRAPARTASSRSTRRRGRRPGSGAQRRRRARRPAPSRRRPARPSRGGSPASASASRAAQASRASASSRSRSALRASEVTAAGPSTSTRTGSSSPRTRARSRAGAAPVSGTVGAGASTGRRPGRAPRPSAGPLDGSCQGRPSPGRSGQAARTVSRRRPSSGRTNGARRAGMPASARAPEPRARPSSTCSAWSSRVWPSSTAPAPSRRRGGLEGGEPGGPGGLLGPARPAAAGRAGRDDPDDPDPVGAQVERGPGDAGGDVARCGGASRGRRTPRETRSRSGPATATAAASRARESAPPLTPTTTGAAGVVADRGPHREPDVADRARRVGAAGPLPRRRAAQAWTRATHAAGSRSSAALGRVSGPVHTALNPPVPTWSVTARTKRAPSAVLGDLGVQAEQAAHGPVDRAGAAAPGPEPGPDLRDRRARPTGRRRP